MEEKNKMIKIMGVIIGLLIDMFGLYYLIKEKKDLESKKIYSIFICVGFIVFTISIFLLMK